jgi:hypothetical protein
VRTPKETNKLVGFKEYSDLPQCGRLVCNRAAVFTKISSKKTGPVPTAIRSSRVTTVMEGDARWYNYYHKGHLTHHHRGSNSTLVRDRLQPTKSDGYAVCFLRVHTERKLRLVSPNHVHVFYCTCSIHFTIFSFYYPKNICL